MKTHRTVPSLKTVLRPPLLRDEGGFLLVVAMLIMLAVSTIAAANLINAMLERNLARNQNYASLALQAAEAGVAEGLAWVNTNQDLLPSAAPWSGNANWPKEVSNGRAITRNLSRDLNGDGDSTDEGETLGSYTVSMRYKMEWFDYNGNGSCNDPAQDPGEIGENYDLDADSTANCSDADVVIYNKCSGSDGCFNFPDSRYNGPESAADPMDRGYPVVEIDSAGTFGEAGYRRVLLNVARDIIDFPGLKGALTTAGGVSLGPSVAKKLDGRNHTSDGTLVDAGVPASRPECEDIDKISDTMFEGGKGVGNAAIPQNFPGTGGPTENDSTETLCTTPWCGLGFKTEQELKDAAVNPATGTSLVFELPAGFTAAQKTTMDNDVKNAIGNGKIVYYKNRGEVFDPSVSLNGILVLEGTYYMRGGDIFKGLLVVKKIDVNGTPDLIGGVIQYDSSDPSSFGNGNINIKYSCDVLLDVKGKLPGPYTSKLSWHRLR